MIKVDDIRKSFGEVEVLRGVSLTVGRGEVVSIVGASGAGKTTLLQIMGTLLTPDGGAVEIDGRTASGMNDRQLSKFRNEKIGFVFQFHHLLPEFDARENVMMPALIGGVPRREADRRARTLLETVGLADRMHHKPAALSGGEQQRLVIARALLNSPRLLLADEPTGNLDPVTADGIMELFKRIAADGCAVVMSTHNISLIEQYPSRTILFSQGRIREVDMQTLLSQAEV